MCRYKLQKSKSESFSTLHKALSEAEFSLLTHTKTRELYAMPSSLSASKKPLPHCWSQALYLPLQNLIILLKTCAM